VQDVQESCCVVVIVVIIAVITIIIIVLLPLLCCHLSLPLLLSLSLFCCGVLAGVVSQAMTIGCFY